MKSNYWNDYEYFGDISVFISPVRLPMVSAPAPHPDSSKVPIVTNLGVAILVIVVVFDASKPPSS